MSPVAGKRLASYAALLVWSLFVAFPLYWMVATSFKEPLDVSQGARFFPWRDFVPTLDAWRAILTGAERDTVGRPLRNSVVIGLTSTLLAVIVGAMAAYGLTRFPVRLGRFGNQDVLLWMISQRMMPPVVTALALFIVLWVVGLTDTRVGLILVYTAFNLPLAVWLLHNFFRQIPSSIEEAALVDGASRAQILWRVVLPVSAPGLVATSLFCLVFAWNEFLFALILTFDRARTMPILIAAQHSQRGIEWWTLSAMSIVTILPVVLIVIFLQKYLVSEVLGGVGR